MYSTVYTNAVKLFNFQTTISLLCNKTQNINMSCIRMSKYIYVYEGNSVVTKFHGIYNILTLDVIPSVKKIAINIVHFNNDTNSKHSISW